MSDARIVKSKFRRKSDHTLDPKGRLNFPSRFRDVLAQYGSGQMMLVPWKTHLRFYPASEWEIIEDKIFAQGRDQHRLLNFMRQVVAGSKECELDKQGRVLIPAGLRSAMGIGLDVAVTGMLEWIEVWDKEAWEAEIQRTMDDYDNIDEGLSSLGVF